MKNSILTFGTLVFSLLVFFINPVMAQEFDYHLEAYKSIANGDCNRAQNLYNAYKEMNEKNHSFVRDEELEKHIEACIDEMNKREINNWREEEVYSEIIINRRVSCLYDYLSEQGWYNKIIANVKRDFPNRMIGISGFPHGDSNYEGLYRKGNSNYIYELEYSILVPNIRYYLNEAIRNAKDGSKIAFNVVEVLGTADESMENQLMGILFDEGFRVVNTISDSDYYINFKMYDNSLQIQMVNTMNKEFEGVSSIQYDTFIDEIKIGKGGICTKVEKICDSSGFGVKEKIRVH